MKKRKILLIGSVPPPITGQSIAFKAIVDHLQYHKIVINQTSKLKLLRPLITILNIGRLLYIFSFINPTLIYFQSSRTKLGSLRDIFLLLFRNRNARIINHLHGADFKLFYYSTIKIHRYFINKLYRIVDSSIVLLDAMKDQYDMFPSMNIVTIPNFYPRELDAIGFVQSMKPIKILYLSNILYSKGIIHLLTAFEMLASINQSLELHIAGKFMGDEYKTGNEIRKIFHEKLECIRGNKGTVFYHGVLSGERKYSLLSHSDIFVLPTFYKTEAFPISIIEAMASGNLIISSKHNYIPYVINDKNGELVESKSSSQIAEAIKRHIANIDKLNKIRFYNFNYARSLFTLNSYIDQVSQIFENYL